MDSLKRYLGKELAKKIIRSNTIEFVNTRLSKLYSVYMTLTIEEEGFLLSFGYTSYVGCDSKLRVIYYDEEDTKRVVEEDRIEIRKGKLWIDNKFVDVDRHDKYELDRPLSEEEMDDPFFDVTDFHDFDCFLEDCPFLEKEKINDQVENNDGSYYMIDLIQPAPQNMKLLADWLKIVVERNMV